MKRESSVPTPFQILVQTYIYMKLHRREFPPPRQRVLHLPQQRRPRGVEEGPHGGQGQGHTVRVQGGAGAMEIHTVMSGIALET